MLVLILFLAVIHSIQIKNLERKFNKLGKRFINLTKDFKEHIKW